MFCHRIWKCLSESKKKLKKKDKTKVSRKSRKPYSRLFTSVKVDDSLMTVEMDTVRLYLESCPPLEERDTDGLYCSQQMEDRVDSDALLMTSSSQSLVSEEARSQGVKCVGCGSIDQIITSRNLFKLLKNNVGICSRHRLMTYVMLDFKKKRRDEQDFEEDSFWKNEGNFKNHDYFEVPFSVNEDRRLRSGVKRFGVYSKSWCLMLEKMVFAEIRTPIDLMKRWKQLTDE